MPGKYVMTRVHVIIVAKEQTFTARGEPEGKLGDYVFIGKKLSLGIERSMGT